MLRGEAVALFGGAPGGDWLGPEENAAPLVVQAVAAVARFVLSHQGTLLVPAEPAIATLAAAIAQDFHEVPETGVIETRGEAERDEGPRPIIVVPWPVQDPETFEAIAPFFPRDLVRDLSRGPMDLLVSEPEAWRYHLSEILDMFAPFCALFVGGGEATMQAFDVVTGRGGDIETGLFVSAGGAAAMAFPSRDARVTRIEEDSEVLDALRQIEAVEDTVIALESEAARSEEVPIGIEPHVPYAALARRRILAALDRRRWRRLGPPA